MTYILWHKCRLTALRKRGTEEGARQKDNEENM